MRKEPSNYEDDVTPIIVNLPPPVDDSSLPGPEFNIVGEDDGFDAILALRDYC